MEVRAQLNHARIAPRKVRMVADMIKGKPVDGVLAQLRHVPNRPAVAILKLINSALANAKHKLGM